MTDKQAEKPSFPYVEFAKAKRFNSHDKPTQVEAIVPVFLNVNTVHKEPIAFNAIRKEQKLRLVGYGNLNDPKFKELRAMLDNELKSSPDMDTYLKERSAMQNKVEKAKANVKTASE